MERSGEGKEIDGAGKSDGKRKRTRKEEEEPTEEEVEEFFAILRRMKMARNHFQRTGRNLTKRWRSALGIDRAVKEAKIIPDGACGSPEKRGELDLNEVPAESENTNDDSMIGTRPE